MLGVTPITSGEEDVRLVEEEDAAPSLRPLRVLRQGRLDFNRACAEIAACDGIKRSPGVGGQGLGCARLA